MSWGDNGPSRANSKEYEENIEKIFGKRDEPKTKRYVKELTDEQRKKQQAYPY